MTFDEAFERLMLHEGGFVNHPNDPGRATKWGITAAFARDEGYTRPMAELSLIEAKGMYQRRFWMSLKLDYFPPALQYSVFDAAVNSGRTRAIRWLQDILGVTVDGVLGQETLNAISQANATTLTCAFNANRLLYLTNLPTWETFGKGWARRLADNLRRISLDMKERV